MIRGTEEVVLTIICHKFLYNNFLGISPLRDQTKNKGGAGSRDTFISENSQCGQVQAIHFIPQEGYLLNN